MDRLNVVNFLHDAVVNKRLNYSRYRCLLCLADKNTNFALCDKCSENLPFNEKCCSICSKPLLSSSICGECSSSHRRHVDRIISVFHYVYPINHLLVGLKYKQLLIAGNILGELMASALTDLTGDSFMPDYMVPVPLHYKRLISRGYNQSACLAKPINKKLNLSINLTICSRRINTKNQTSLNGHQRRKNVLNAFEINGNVSGKNIVLIDDVITTGSTVNELARTFKSAGATSVQAWCCAV